MSTKVITPRCSERPDSTRVLPKQVVVTVVVPTYCEGENLGELIPRVSRALSGQQITHEVIVVDDNSPDETRDVCSDLADSYPLRLLVRTSERGLSSAVLHGLSHARGEILVVMDADLSHPPEKVPELVSAIREQEADFVIGSRYVPGGGTDESWGLFRWLNSKIATWLAYPLTPARDPMAGFFALHRETYLQAKQLDPIGYKIGLELIVKCGCRNLHEVPIQFRDRLHGTSKLSVREQINYLRHLRRLYVFRGGWLSRPLQFLLVGGTGMVVDLLCFACLMTILPLTFARGVAIGVAMTWNFCLNRRLTFAEARTDPVVRQYLLFCVACSMGALINWSISMALSSGVPFFLRHNLLAAFCGIVAGTLFNYQLSRRVVFQSEDSGEDSQPGQTFEVQKRLEA